MDSETNVLLAVLAIVIGVLVIVIEPLFRFLVGTALLVWGLWTLVKQASRTVEKKTV